MRFCQLDRITLLEPGRRIEATKRLTGDEDYLRDHFPRFAVMPGVLMLEAMCQASILLARATENYESGLILVRSVKNVKFADFVRPGETLEIESEIFKQDGSQFTMKAAGRKGDSLAVAGRIVLESDQRDAPSVNQYAAAYTRELTHKLCEAGNA